MVLRHGAIAELMYALREEERAPVGRGTCWKYGEAFSVRHRQASGVVTEGRAVGATILWMVESQAKTRGDEMAIVRARARAPRGCIVIVLRCLLGPRWLALGRSLMVVMARNGVSWKGFEKTLE